MAKVVEFEQIHSNVGGIDIGSREIYVSIGGSEVVKFGTFTVDYHACCKYLKEKRIESVAMEATFCELAGIESKKQTKRKAKQKC
jgi:hypothetical protein